MDSRAPVSHEHKAQWTQEPPLKNKAMQRNTNNRLKMCKLPTYCTAQACGCILRSLSCQHIVQLTTTCLCTRLRRMPYIVRLLDFYFLKLSKAPLPLPSSWLLLQKILHQLSATCILWEVVGIQEKGPS